MIANRILLIALIVLAILAWIFPPFATRITHNNEAEIGEKVFLKVVVSSKEGFTRRCVVF